MAQEMSWQVRYRNRGVRGAANSIGLISISARSKVVFCRHVRRHVHTYILGEGKFWETPEVLVSHVLVSFETLTHQKRKMRAAVIQITAWYQAFGNER